MNNVIKQFLEESNNIEGVFDDDSLQQAHYAWDYAISQDELTPSVITKTHKILMLHQGLAPNERGYFRRVEVRIGAGYGRPWPVVPSLINQWCRNAKDSKTAEEIKQDHIIYEQIHPFVDGNGRTGRIFLNWQRVKNNLPILVIKNSEKQAYYAWFNEKD